MCLRLEIFMRLFSKLFTGFLLPFFVAAGRFLLAFPTQLLQDAQLGINQVICLSQMTTPCLM